MVCAVCGSKSMPRDDEECFRTLLKQLESHFRDRVQQCEAKDLEIAKLKEALASRDEREMAASPIHSPTLFSQSSSEIIDFGLEDDSLLPSGQVMPGNEETATELLESMNEENVRPETPNDSYSPMKIKEEDPGDSELVPKKCSAKPHAVGWTVKPSNLSFTNLNNKTQIFSPTKGKKNAGKVLTIKECFQSKLPAAAQLAREKSRARTAIKRSPSAIIHLDDENQSTPKRKPLMLTKTVKEERRQKESELNDSLEDFCETCREYFIVNPPKWTSAKQREQKVRECMGHKEKKFQGHETPPGFWKVGFSQDLPDQMKTQVFIKKKH